MSVDTFDAHLLGVNKYFADTLQLGMCCADTLQVGIIDATFVFFLPRLNRKDEEAMTQQNEEIWKQKKKKWSGHTNKIIAYPLGTLQGEHVQDALLKN